MLLLFLLYNFTVLKCCIKLFPIRLPVIYTFSTTLIVINQTFLWHLNVTCKPQLAYYVPSFVWTTPLTSRHILILICVSFSNLEIWFVSTHTFVVSENIPFSIKTPLILLMSTFKDKMHENVSLTDHACGIRHPNCPKLAINRKNKNDITIWRNDVTIRLFWHCLDSLVKFSYWSKFHLNVSTGSEWL